MKYGFFLLFLFCLGLLSCSKQDKSLPAPETATTGSFELLADETLKPVVDSLVAGFNIQTPEAKVTVRYTSAAAALDELISSKTRLVLIGRPLTKAEHHVIDSAKIDLPEFDVALNSIAVITSSKNPLQSLSFDSLRKLVSGNLSMKYYSTTYLSSTETALDSVFGLEKSTLSGQIHRFNTTDSVISAVQMDPESIGFIGAAWWNNLKRQSDSSIKALSISSPQNPTPLMLHLAYLWQGMYPLAMRVCAYTIEAPNSIPRGFLAYAMSADGQRVFMNYDILPRTQIIKLVPQK